MTAPPSGYAQTNVQLYRQMQAEGYTGAELARVRRAYELVMVLFTATYRPSGKPNIDHLVGTASILSRLHAPVELVLAGLLHSVYQDGDFGGPVPGITRRKREIVTGAVGPDAEMLVARYAVMRSDVADLSVFRAEIPALDRIGRHVVVLRLADVLEDHLDQGVLYCSNATGRQRSSRRMRPELVAMAEELGVPVLARELDRTLAAVASAGVPAELCGAPGRNRVFRVSLPSYRPRLSVMLGRALIQGGRHVRSRLRGGLGRVGRWRRSRSDGRPAPLGSTEAARPFDGGGHSR